MKSKWYIITASRIWTFSKGLLFVLFFIVPESALPTTTTTIPITTTTMSVSASATTTSVQTFGNDYNNSLGMTFRAIPAGTFTIGSPTGEVGSYYWEKPQHQVTISSFYMQTTAVTQDQWKMVMGSNPSSNSSYNSSCGSCPVESVSWYDVQIFLTKLNTNGQGTYRLPTEAEWEYAARAGTTTAYFFGNDASKLGDYVWYEDNSSSKTHPVATKLPNPWGLCDMHGNVWEWVSDWYGSYGSGAVTDPQGPTSGSGRVVRGGSWIDDQAHVRSAYRNGFDPALRLNVLGFRLSTLSSSSATTTTSTVPASTTSTTTSTVPATTSASVASSPPVSIIRGIVESDLNYSLFYGSLTKKISLTRTTTTTISASTSCVPGDVAPLGNSNGVVDIGDAVVVARMVAGLIPVDLKADVAPLENPNGAVDIGDAVVVARAVAGLVAISAASGCTSP